SSPARSPPPRPARSSASPPPPARSTCASSPSTDSSKKPAVAPGAQGPGGSPTPAGEPRPSRTTPPSPRRYKRSATPPPTPLPPHPHLPPPRLARTRRFAASVATYPAEWQQAAIGETSYLHVTADELHELLDEHRKVNERFRERWADRNEHADRRPQGTLPVE